MIGFSPSLSVEHAVGQRRVRAGADRPRDGKPVVAVDHGRQIGLARGNREPGRVRDPQPVRTLGVEIPVRQVLRRLGQLALVRAVPFRALEQGRQAMPGRSRMTRFADTLDWQRCIGRFLRGRVPVR